MQRGRRGPPPRRTPECEREDSSARLTLSVPKTHSERGDSEKWRQEGEVVSGPEAEPRPGLGGAWGIGPASVLSLPGSRKRGLFALCAAKRCVAGLPASPRKTGPGAIYNPTLALAGAWRLPSTFPLYYRLGRQAGTHWGQRHRPSVQGSYSCFLAQDAVNSAFWGWHPRHQVEEPAPPSA